MMKPIEINNPIVNITPVTDSAVIALAKAAEANALAIQSIAELQKNNGPTYGIYVAANQEQPQ